MIKHFVLINFKEDTSDEDKDKVSKAFLALADLIPSVVGRIQTGTDIHDAAVSRCKGFTHIFIVRFDDKAGLDLYGPHEAHEEFKRILAPHKEDLLVIDIVEN